jgi:hypothetical protein
MVMSLYGGVKSGGMRLLDIFAARTVDARIPGGTWYANQKFMFAAEWSNYPSLVAYRLEWAFTFNFVWFALAAGCALVLLWFRKRNSAISALILLAGGFSWYYVMFQHTHIHHFTGQYSFMAICPIFGLIVSEVTTSAQSFFRLLRQPFTSARYQAFLVPRRLGLNVAAAILIVAASYLTTDYVKKTYGLVRQTLALSRVVQAKYRQAVNDICQQHSKVTLADLQQASSAWGIDWRAKQLADTNQLPQCPG